MEPTFIYAVPQFKHRDGRSLGQRLHLGAVQGHTAPPYIASADTSVLWRITICASVGDTGMGQPCATVACSFMP